MVALLISLLRAHWKLVADLMLLLAVIGVIAVQHEELANDKVKLFNAAAIHEQDQGRIAYLSKTLQDQNDAVTALQAAQALKEQITAKALAQAQVRQQKVVTLLASTNDKKPSTCTEAMPDVRNLLRGIQQ